MSTTISNFIFYPEGFSITIEGRVQKKDWGEIEEIAAYKSDLLTFDEICIEITFEKSSIRITEQTPGWDEFIKRVEIQFPSIDKGWQTKIALPPFETNYTILYKKYK